MVASRTLRRKLQKKLKHRPYRKCPKCGGRMTCKLLNDDGRGWRLFKHCGGEMGYGHDGALKCLWFIGGAYGAGCGWWEELFYRDRTGRLEHW